MSISFLILYTFYTFVWFCLKAFFAVLILEEVKDLCVAQTGAEGASSLGLGQFILTRPHMESHSGSLFHLDQTAETGSHDAGEGQGGEEEGEGSNSE